MAKGPAYNRFLRDAPGGALQRLPYRISPPPVRHYPDPPKLVFPPGACDTHIHIFGPQAKFPLSAAKINGPFSDVIYEDALLDDALAMLDACGIDRAIFVGTMLYGYRYDPMVHALTSAPDRLRGVAILDPDTTDGELELLDKAGVVGIRVSAAFESGLDERTMRRATDMNWTLEALTQDWESWREALFRADGRIVIEHMGEMDPSAGIDGKTWKFLLEALDRGNIWVKLSARVSHQQTFPFDDLLPFARKLIEHAPERILYGSDWPHPVYFGRPMVNDVSLADMMLDWAPDEKTRNRIMIENAAEAYDWPL